MNLLEIAKNRLRKLFCFRLSILIASILLIIVCLYIPDENNIELQNVIIGVAASGLVWSLVELFDFVNDTYKNMSKKQLNSIKA